MGCNLIFLNKPYEIQAQHIEGNFVYVEYIIFIFVVVIDQLQKWMELISKLCFIIIQGVIW